MSRGPATVGRLRAALGSALRHVSAETTPVIGIGAGSPPVCGSARLTAASSEQVGKPLIATITYTVLLGLHVLLLVYFTNPHRQ